MAPGGRFNTWNKLVLQLWLIALIMVTKNYFRSKQLQVKPWMEAGSRAAGLWLSHLLSKVSTVQYPFVGVINWPRHPGLSSLLGWSSTILIPGWANLSLQAQWARQCRFAASILVTKWRGASGWVFKWESEEKIRTCCRRRYVPDTWWSIHFESNKNSFKAGGGQWNLQGDTAKKSGIHKLIMQERRVSWFRLSGRGKCGYERGSALHTDVPPKSKSPMWHTIVLSLRLLQNVQVINLQNSHNHDCSQ